METDLIFEIQRDDSTHNTTVVYYRLDTKKQETFVFNIGYSDKTRLVFDGTNLVCPNISESTQCNKLPIDKPVRVLLISVDINPRKGETIDNNWNRNRYNLKGSFASVKCEKSEFIDHLV